VPVAHQRDPHHRPGIGFDLVDGGVVGLLGQSSFTATLGEIGTPTQEGSGASVPFQVAARWRTNFGQNRDRQLELRALLERVGSEWQVVRVAR